jgi:hypothetical protein
MGLPWKEGIVGLEVKYGMLLSWFVRVLKSFTVALYREKVLACKGGNKGRYCNKGVQVWEHDHDLGTL